MSSPAARAVSGDEPLVGDEKLVGSRETGEGRRRIHAALRDWRQVKSRRIDFTLTPTGARWGLSMELRRDHQRFFASAKDCGSKDWCLAVGSAVHRAAVTCLYCTAPCRAIVMEQCERKLSETAPLLRLPFLALLQSSGAFIEDVDLRFQVRRVGYCAFAMFFFILP